jgi:hypothetical protein
VRTHITRGHELRAKVPDEVRHVNMLRARHPGRSPEAPACHAMRRKSGSQIWGDKLLQSQYSKSAPHARTRIDPHWVPHKRVPPASALKSNAPPRAQRHSVGERGASHDDSSDSGLSVLGPYGARHGTRGMDAARSSAVRRQPSASCWAASLARRRRRGPGVAWI